MMMMWLWLLGCAPESIAPSVDANELAMLQGLPAESDALFWIDLQATRGTPLGLHLPAIEAKADAHLDGGLTASDVDRVAGACGSLGCLSLAEGRFERPLQGREGLVHRGGGFDAHTAVGRLVARRLDQTRAVFGDASPIDAAVADASRLDLSPLADRIPAGDNWVLLRDQDSLLNHAEDRAEQVQDGEVRTQLLDLVSAARGAPSLVREIDSVALSHDLSTDTVRVRAWCDTEGSARALMTAWTGWRGLNRGNPAAAASAVREGGVVEWTLTDATDVMNAEWDR